MAFAIFRKGTVMDPRIPLNGDESSEDRADVRLRDELIWLARLGPRHLFSFYRDFGSKQHTEKTLHIICQGLVDEGLLTRHPGIGDAWYSLTRKGLAYRSDMHTKITLHPVTLRMVASDKLKLGQDDESQS